MNRTKFIRWGLLFLTLATIFAYPLFEKVYRSARDEGWITFFSTDRGECDLSSANIVADRQERVWVIGGCCGECDFFQVAHVFDGETWSELEVDRQMADSFRVDALGRLWRLKQKKGDGGQAQSLEIAVFDGGRWTNYLNVDVKRIDTRFANAGFAIDQQGKIWITYTRLPPKNNPALWTTGVSIFDGDVMHTFNRDNTPILASERVFGPLFDSQNRAWYWNQDYRLLLFDGMKWTDYSLKNPNQEGYGQVLAIALDANEHPWLATSRGYILSAYGNQVIDWAQILDLGYPFYVSPGGDYFDFAFDKDNRIWIASWVENDGVLLVYDGSTWGTLTHANSGFSRGGITELEVDSAGNIWVGTPSGINMLRAQAANGSHSQVSRLWIWLRSDLTGNPPAIGRYWLLPFFLFLCCFALFFQPGYRLTALSLLFGGLELVPIPLTFIFLVMFGSIFSGYMYAVIFLMLPAGLLGVVISAIALLPYAKQDRKYRHLARIGLAIALIGILVSLAWRLVILALPV